MLNAGAILEPAKWHKSRLKRMDDRLLQNNILLLDNQDNNGRSTRGMVPYTVNAIESHLNPGLMSDRWCNLPAVSGTQSQLGSKRHPFGFSLWDTTRGTIQTSSTWTPMGSLPTARQRCKPRPNPNLRF